MSLLLAALLALPASAEPFVAEEQALAAAAASARTQARRRNALAAAAKDARTIARAEALFKEAIAGAIDFRASVPFPPILGYTTADADRLVALPELGGAAALGKGALTLVDVPDPRAAALRALGAAGCDEAALRAAFSAHGDVMTSIDKQSYEVLSLTLGRLASERARGIEEAKLLRGLCHNVATELVNAAESHREADADADAADRAAARSGAVIGSFFVKPPTWTPSGWAAGAPPGVGRGRSVVLVFQPEGYDLYDSTAAGAEDLDPSALPVVRVRPAGWKARFDALWRP